MAGHLIEHEVGIYVGLLLLACSVGVALKYVTHLPYTIALTLVGLIVGTFQLAPDIAETGFSKELIFFVALPPLLFQGALHLNLNKLLAHVALIGAFAILGVAISTGVIAGMMYWLGGMDVLLIALLFGAMLSPTDPVSVLALFKETKVPDDLRTIVEGESLFNDGTGVVVFTIVLALLTGGGEFSAAGAAGKFVVVALGGAAIGLVLGLAAFVIVRTVDDHLLENALCLVLAYGSFWVAEVAHVSGVIATVIAGLLIGNFGKHLAMSVKTRETVDTFFESIDFIINSLLFVLIGLELQTVTWVDVRANLLPLSIAIVALVVSRALAVYPIYVASGGLSTHRPFRWAHVLVWGGLRGSIPIALLLGLPHHPAIEPYRTTLLVACFGTVFFSLVVQGITVKPLLRILRLTGPGSGPDSGPESTPPAAPSH